MERATLGSASCGMEWGGAHESHNTRDRGIITGRTTGGRVRKAVVTRGRIRLASPNIRTGRAGGLEMAFRALQQGDVDVGFLQEIKLTQGIQTRHSAG